MKILHYVKVLSGGGAGRAIRGLIRHLHANCEVAVEGDHVDLPMGDIPVRTHVGPDQLVAIVQAEGFDVVHWHWWTETPALLALQQARVDVRQVLTLHVHSQLPEYRLTPREIDAVDRIIVVSPAVLDLQCYSEIAPEKISYINAGAEFDELLTIQLIEHEGFNVGRFSNLDPVKIPPDVIRVLDRVDIPDVRFYIGGQGSLLEALQREAGLAEEGRYVIPGYVPEIAEVLPLLDVYCYQLPSHSYAASELNVQEAMAAGLPVVLLPSKGAEHLIHDGQTGLVVHSEDALVKACQKLYDDPQLRQRLGANAREFARQNYGAANSAIKYQAVYDELLAGSQTTIAVGRQAVCAIAEQIQRSEGETVDLLKSWQSADLPAQQRSLANQQLADMRAGNPPPEFQTFGEAMAQLVRDGDRILDVGCASGYYKAVLDHYCGGRQFEYVGTDYSEAMLEEAKKHESGVQFVQADARQIPLPDGAFDIVFTSAMLEHIPDYEAALDEIFRLARRQIVLHRTWLAPQGETTTNVEPGYPGQELFRVALGGNDLAHLLTSRGACNTQIVPVRPHADPRLPGHFLVAFEKGPVPASATV